jgi:hypothetical protein
VLEINREELAWAAGFLDGEGNFGFYNHVTRQTKKGLRTYAALNVTAAQIERRVLDRLKKAVGAGHVNGPYNKRRPNSKPLYCFVGTSFEDCQHIIGVVWNWLSPVKQIQASKALIQAVKYYQYMLKNPIKRGRY